MVYQIKTLLMIEFFLVIGLAVADENLAETLPNSKNPRITESCSLVMAPSSIPQAGWGVFALKDQPKGTQIVSGDVVVQVSDLNATFAVHAKRLALDYGWNAAETGGQYEGQAVMSVSPGIGMLANGSPKLFNVLPALEPNLDESGVTRHNSPGAGAFSHYHNYTYVSQQYITAGTEILVNYGPNWFDQRREKVNDLTQETQPLHRSVDELRQNGFCIDNLQPGQSNIPNAGRGAFASRSLPKGTIVSPVPVVPVTRREAMHTTRLRQTAAGDSIPHTSTQLLLNYLYGHPNSSVLLVPYAPMVNLINHSSKQPNVELRWSSVNSQHEILSIEDLERINTDADSSNGKLLLELVATRDIEEGEEVVMSYGEEWERAWDFHQKDWEPYQRSYAPAYIIDEAAPILATMEETKEESPYPNNVITSCFYRYVHTDTASPRNISNAEWKHSRGLFELRNLRPCSIMQRFEVEQVADNKEAEPVFYYTVVIRNRFGLLPQERIPPGHMHVVTRVPRRAIRFTDKIYTTDQHLPGAFRKEIGLGSDVFPAQWINPSATVEK